MKHQQEELCYLLCENLLFILCKLLKVKHHWLINHCYFVHPLLVHAGISWEFYSSYQPNNMKEQQELHCSLCENLLAILCNLFKGKNHWFVNYCYFVHHPLLVYAGSIPPTTQSYQPNNNKN